MSADNRDSLPRSTSHEVSKFMGHFLRSSILTKATKPHRLALEEEAGEPPEILLTREAYREHQLCGTPALEAAKVKVKEVELARGAALAAAFMVCW